MSTHWDKNDAEEPLGRRNCSPEETATWMELHKRSVFARRYLEDTKGNPWCVRDYHVDSLESYKLRKVHCDGRDVGKTAEIEIIAAWAAAACPNSELLERRMNEQTIVFPRLPDRESQYAGHTYTVSANGGIVYSKGDDHIIDADRCAMLAHYRDTHEDCPETSLGVRIETF